jgi:hypothetical protein
MPFEVEVPKLVSPICRASLEISRAESQQFYFYRLCNRLGSSNGQLRIFLRQSSVKMRKHVYRDIRSVDVAMIHTNSDLVKDPVATEHK